MRGLATGKSRLAGVLDGGERAALNRLLLDRVLDAVGQAEGGLARCIVASACDDALSMAQRRGALHLRENIGTGLNAALEGARAWAIDHGAMSILTLAADLPDVDGAALHRLFAGVPADFTGVIADKHARGTNGLLLPAHVPLRFAFGEGSLARHVAALRDAGLPFRVWHDPALAFDVDSTADHAAWCARQPHAMASASASASAAAAAAAAVAH